MFVFLLIALLLIVLSAIFPEQGTIGMVLGGFGVFGYILWKGLEERKKKKTVREKKSQTDKGKTSSIKKEKKEELDWVDRIELIDSILDD